MKYAAALTFGIVLAGCAPAPPPPGPAARPVALDPATVNECNLIGREIAEQQRTAAFAVLDTTPLAQAAAQVNAYNVINNLRARAAIIGCV